MNRYQPRIPTASELGVHQEFVKELSQREDISNSEKAKIFNQKMLEYGNKIGKVLGESVINCLRELAVNALKAECGR